MFAHILRLSVLSFFVCLLRVILLNSGYYSRRNKVGTYIIVTVVFCRSRRLFCTQKTTCSCLTGSSLAGTKKLSSLPSAFSIIFWTWASGQRGPVVPWTRLRITPLAAAATAVARWLSMSPTTSPSCRLRRASAAPASTWPVAENAATTLRERWSFSYV